MDVTGLLGFLRPNWSTFLNQLEGNPTLLDPQLAVPTSGECAGAQLATGSWTFDLPGNNARYSPGVGETPAFGQPAISVGSWHSAQLNGCPCSTNFFICARLLPGDDPCNQSANNVTLQATCTSVAPIRTVTLAEILANQTGWTIGNTDIISVSPSGTSPAMGTITFVNPSDQFQYEPADGEVDTPVTFTVRLQEGTTCDRTIMLSLIYDDFCAPFVLEHVLLDTQS